MYRRAHLSCISYDRRTDVEQPLKEFDLYLKNKDAAKSHQDTLDEVYSLKQTTGLNPYYRCSCANSPKLFIARRPRSPGFILRDQHINQHTPDCPLYTKVINTDGDVKKHGIDRQMFKMPSSKPLMKSGLSLKSSRGSLIIGKNKHQRPTFNSLMDTAVELSSSIVNDRSIISMQQFKTTLTAQILNIPFEGSSTFKEYRIRLNERGASIKFLIFELETFTIQYQKTRYPFEDRSLQEDLKKGLPLDPYRFYKAGDQISGVRGDILQKSIDSLKVFDNKIKGPYVAILIKTKKKGEAYYNIPQLYIRPLMITSTKILPVESDMERECLRYASDALSGAKMYKPLTLDKHIYWKQIVSFLHEHPDEKMDLQNTFKKYKELYPDSSPIRPDLFIIHEEHVFVFEIAGMLNRPDYVRHLERKEKDFYALLERTHYHRITDPQGIVNIVLNTADQIL